MGPGPPCEPACIPSADGEGTRPEPGPTGVRARAWWWGSGEPKPRTQSQKRAHRRYHVYPPNLEFLEGMGKACFFKGRGLVPFLDCNHKLIIKNVTNNETHRKRKEKSSIHNSTPQAANVLIWSLRVHTYVHTLTF